MSTTNPAVAVGVDGCAGSTGAIHYAVAEAVRRRAPLRLMHVMPLVLPSWSAPAAVVFPELRHAADSILEEALEIVRQADPTVDVVTRLDHGSSAAKLIANAEDVQLLVIGSETQHGINRMLFGATTLAVASRAAAPVVVVPDTWREDSHGGRVVVGIKDQTNARELLGVAFAEADARAGSVRAVTAWSLPDPYLDRIEVRTHASEWEAEARQLVEPLLAEWHSMFPGVTADFDVEHGQTASVLVATSLDADLLVLARRPHLLPPYGHLGGVGHRVLLHSATPILVVPHGRPSSIFEELVLEEAITGAIA